MAELQREVLLVYIRRHLMMSEAELADTTDRLARFASARQCEVSGVFVEEIETSPAAFEALIAAVERLGASTVVLPSPLHFAVLGPPGAVRYHFEHLTGAQVVVADYC